MITLYTCNNKDCSNNGVTYRVEDAPALMVCGGCQTALTGEAE